MSITLQDFQIVNTWKEEVDGEKWSDGEAKFLIDQSTGKKYFNESQDVVGFKCALLTLGTPFVHSAASIANLAYRVLRLATFANFWIEKDGEKKYSFENRLLDAGKDLLRIVLVPISILSLELSAVYGLFTPYNGRKLYATIERATYGNFILAPCFQPDPTQHAFGGDINKKNAF